MAKHDRRKTSGQPPNSRPVTIQVPLPVLGVVNGVREAFHGCYGMTPCQHSCVRQHLCPLERRAPSAISPRVGRRNDERSKGASTTSHAAIR